MTTQHDFLKNFADIFGDGLFLYCIGHPSQAFYTPFSDQLTWPSDDDVYFAPAIYKRVENKPATRDNALGAKACWIDNDDLEFPLTTLPYSAVVSSGHGYHLYWFLDRVYSPEQIEELNKILIDDADGAGVDSSCWNINRVLRIPGTVNTKEDPIVPVILRDFRPQIVYSYEDIKLLEVLDDKVKKKIKTADSRGYRSRSELDYYVVASLAEKGASDDLIKRIFDYQAIGAKHRDSPAHYLSRTLEQAKKKASTPVPDKRKKQMSSIIEADDGFYHMTGKYGIRLSTFTLDPKLLLKASTPNGEETFLCDVKIGDQIIEDQPFPRSAFNSLAKMDQCCTTMAMSFQGSDKDVRMLLPYLYGKLIDKGLPTVLATNMTGVHVVDGQYLYVGTKQTLSKDQMWEGFQGPLAWLPSGTEHPEIVFDAEDSNYDDKFAGLEVLTRLNDPNIIWPMIGWYAATVFKNWLSKEHKLPFPLLNVTGSFGSGKTTLIQKVFMKLFGQAEPKSYDAGTTKFVILALLGSTNALPIAFSEFRYDSVEKFLRYILLFYDSGNDPRGRADQTTKNYQLLAPFSVDGEDAIVDPAAKERIISVALSKETTQEGSDAYKAMNEFRIPYNFAKHYIQYCLDLMESGKATDILHEARADLHEAFPYRIPGRVRNNYTAILLGINVFCAFTGLERPDPKILEASLRNVCNLDTGRSSPLVDEFIEAIANVVGNNMNTFKWDYDKDHAILYFQMSSAHSWWLGMRKRQGRGGLEREAIIKQLLEQPYYIKPEVRNGVIMYGVDLKIAYNLELGVPSYLELMTMFNKVL